MKRRILVIKKDEILKHFQENKRQDIKIIPPEILTEELFNFLKSKGKDVKPEQPLKSYEWIHSRNNEPNNICESTDFIDERLLYIARGPFAISFANEKALQDEHYHKEHWEIYFSEYPMSVEYKFISEQNRKKTTLPQGGAILFGPEVVHKMNLGGLTIIIEVPSASNDKF